MKTLISLVFLAIVASLVMAGYFMLKREGADRSRNMAYALTVRIGLSVALFIAIMILWWLGYITPTGRFPAQ